MVKNMDDYFGILSEEFKDIPESVIKKIIKEGLKNMQRMIHKDHDLRFGNHREGKQYRLTFTRSKPTQLERNIRAKYNKIRLDAYRKRQEEKHKKHEG